MTNKDDRRGPLLTVWELPEGKSGGSRERGRGINKQKPHIREGRTRKINDYRRAGGREGVAERGGALYSIKLSAQACWNTALPHLKISQDYGKESKG